jgi:hypothetical protein
LAQDIVKESKLTTGSKNDKISEIIVKRRIHGKRR